MYYLTKIACDGKITHKESSACPSLEYLQKQVGGYIEGIPKPDTYKNKPCVIFCNEEGRINLLPFNHQASKLVGYCILGDIIIVAADTLKEINKL